jgi:hypothetical protein
MLEVGGDDYFKHFFPQFFVITEFKSSLLFFLKFVK